jgi:hypothetical protein
VQLLPMTATFMVLRSLISLLRSMVSGWRENTRETELECLIAGRIGRGFSKSQVLADCLIDEFNEETRHTGKGREQRTYAGPVPGGHPAFLVREGSLFATRGWLANNVLHGWKLSNVSLFLKRHREVRRVGTTARLGYYNVGMFIAAVLAMRKQHPEHELRPSVLKLIQGSGSINEKLLEFVAQSD